MEEAVTNEDTDKANHQEQTLSTQTGTLEQKTEAQKEAKEDTQPETPTIEAELPTGLSQEFRLKFKDPSKTDKVPPVVLEDRDCCTDRMARLMFKYLDVEDPEDQEAIKNKEGSWDTSDLGQ